MNDFVVVYSDIIIVVVLILPHQTLSYSLKIATMAKVELHIPVQNNGRHGNSRNGHSIGRSTALAANSLFLLLVLGSYEFYYQSHHSNCISQKQSAASSDGVPSPDSWKKESLQRSSKKLTTTYIETSSSLFDAQDVGSVIREDELPGYTGWARPFSTLTHYFVPHDKKTNPLRQSTPFITSVTCQGHDLCSSGGSLFYLRAYGPALLTGTVHDHNNGTYTFAILPHDVGVYKLEAVLTFSHPPKFEDLPVPFTGSTPEVAYEGYMLPGFPLEFEVVPADILDRFDSLTVSQRLKLEADHRRQLQEIEFPKCKAHDFVENSVTSPLEKARWVLKQKPRFHPHNTFKMVSNYSSEVNISLANYQTSETSVGFTMDYQYTNCTIDSLEELTNNKRWEQAVNSSKRKVNNKRRLHFLFFGDSNIRNQHNFFRDYVAKPSKLMGGKMALSYVEVMKYWPHTWDEARAKFLKIYDDNPNDHFIVVYNLGLHEISNRCSLFGQKTKRVEANPGPCIPFYSDDVTNMTDLVLSKPAMVRIWQSTTAGWPKWGVFGVAWPQKWGQYFPLATDMCASLNGVAHEIVSKRDVSIMDTYWMALPRPDHREVIDKDASRTSYKLVHMGPEVYLLLLRKLLTIALEALSDGQPDELYL